MKQSLENYKKIVIKIGSSLLFTGKAKLDCGLLNEVAVQVSSLVKQGKEVVIVSSGAIAMGMSVLKLESRPRELSGLQAAAAIGQHELMDAYRRFFRDKGLNCGQILLTWDDFNDRKRYLNAKHTLETLLELNSVPVINENDTVSTDEIKFGDNDRLSALVASLISADILIILSDVDGLLDKGKNVINTVGEITPQIKELACPTDKKTCVGGMVTKLEAAKVSVGAGIPCVIANGRRKDIILSVLRGAASCGTLFIPKKGLNARKRWIAFGAKPKGKIMVDGGAKNALLDKKSLLCVGVTGIIGEFSGGDMVSVIDAAKHEFARGKAGVSSKELERMKGCRFDKEVIHRDNIVILP